MGSSVDSSGRNGIMPKLHFKVSLPSMDNKVNPSSLTGALRPMVVSLKMAGLCFETQYQRLVSVSLIFCYVVLVLNWIHALGLFVVYNNNSLSTFEILVKIVFHILFIHCAVTVTIFLTKINRVFPRFVKKWETYRAKYKGVIIQSMAKYTMKLIAALWVVYALVAAAGLMLMSTKYVQVIRIILKPFVDKDTPMAIVISCRIFHYFVFLPYIFSVAFIFIICKLLNMEYIDTLVQTNIPRRNHVESRDSSRDLDKLRRRHLALTEVVTNFEEAVSGYLLTVISFDIAVIGFYLLLVLVKDVVYVDGGVVPFLTHFLTISIPGLHLFFIALAGYTLNRQVIYLTLSN